MPCDHLPLKSPIRLPEKNPIRAAPKVMSQNEASDESDSDGGIICPSQLKQMTRGTRGSTVPGSREQGLDRESEPEQASRGIGRMPEFDTESQHERANYGDIEESQSSEASADEDTGTSSEESLTDGGSDTGTVEGSRRPVRKKFPKRVFTYDTKGNPTSEIILDAYYDIAVDGRMDNTDVMEPSSEGGPRENSDQGSSNSVLSPEGAGEGDSISTEPISNKEQPTTRTRQPRKIFTYDAKGEPTYKTMSLMTSRGTWV